MTQEGSCKIRYYFETGEELERFMKEAEKLKKRYHGFEVVNVDVEDMSVLPYFEAHLSVGIENKDCEYSSPEPDVGYTGGMEYMVDAYEVKQAIGRAMSELSLYPYDDEIIEDEIEDSGHILEKYSDDKCDYDYD